MIACGGGGIPVLAQGNKLKGASAVIEKDSAAGRLADLVDADRFVILTGVEKVCLNFGKENEQTIEEMTVSQAIQYIEEGQFGEGTMLPKIQAAIEFIGNSAVRSVLITKLDSSREDSVETTGTVIHK